MAQVADRFLACGVLDHGFARIRCDACAHEYLLAFSCKCRCFCPSCHAKRLAIWAQWLDATLLAPVPHRQVVLTIPKRLRAYWHPHLHLLFTDGGFRPDGTFVSALTRTAITPYTQVTSSDIPIPRPGAAGAAHHRHRRRLQDLELARGVLEAKPQIRDLERAAVEQRGELAPVDGLARALPTALERELAESLRRGYSLVRRFVRVGTGLLRADMQRAVDLDKA